MAVVDRKKVNRCRVHKKWCRKKESKIKVDIGKFMDWFLQQPITEKERKDAAFPLPEGEMTRYQAMRYIMEQAGHDVSSIFPETPE